MTDIQLLNSYNAATETEPKIFAGSEILAQVSPFIREQSFLPRPSDVRLLMVTSDEKERHFTFKTHGHPQNEESTVHFNGQNGIMMMLHGEGAFEQLSNAQKVIDRLHEKGLSRITPEFVASEIADPAGSLRSAVAQIYGPVTGRKGVEDQANRFVSVEITSPNGPMRSEPVITNDYAVGMRAPVKEEVYLLMHNSEVPAYIIGGGYSDKIAGTFGNKASLRGDGTAAEKFVGTFMVANTMVLAVDAGDKTIKPIITGTAAKSFDLNRMTVLTLNNQGKVTNQYRPTNPNDRMQWDNAALALL